MRLTQAGRHLCLATLLVASACAAPAEEGAAGQPALSPGHNVPAGADAKIVAETHASTSQRAPRLSPPPVTGNAQGQDFYALHFALYAPQHALPADDCVLSGEIVNTGRSPEVLPWLTGDHYNGLLLAVKDEDGEPPGLTAEAAAHGYTISGGGFTSWRVAAVLKAGESYPVKIDLGRVFRLEPGQTYWLQVEWLGVRIQAKPGQKLLSNVVQIKIAQPS